MLSCPEVVVTKEPSGFVQLQLLAATKTWTISHVCGSKDGAWNTTTVLISKYMFKLRDCDLPMAMSVHFQKDVFEKGFEPAGHVTFMPTENGKESQRPNILGCVLAQTTGNMHDLVGH